MIIVMTTSFLAPFMSSSINVAVPAIGAEFQGGAHLMSWVVSSYILATAAVLLPLGRLADILGRKKVFISGVLLFGCFSALCGMAQAAEWLIGLRIMQGIGASMIFATNTAILTSVFPPQRRGRALGLSAAATYISLSVGPALGGFITHHLGWRMIFFFPFPLSLAIAAFTAAFLKGEWRGAPGERFDFGGSVLYMSGLVGVLWGLSSFAVSAWGRWALFAGVLLLGLFMWYETRVVHPMFDVRLFLGNPVFAFSNLAAMINYSATAGLGFIISLHLQVVLGLSADRAGLILLAQPLVMAIFSPQAGALSDRLQPRAVASSGMAVTTGGLLLFSMLQTGTPLWVIAAELAVVGFGFALFASPNNNAIMSAVEPRQYGVASSALATMRMSGQAISMAIVTLIISAYIGEEKLGPANIPALILTARTAFAVFAALCALGIAASLARGRMERSHI